jgi:hypothetical protein
VSSQGHGEAWADARVGRAKDALRAFVVVPDAADTAVIGMFIERAAACPERRRCRCGT